MVDPRMMRVWVGEGRGGSGFAVTYLTFCQNFAVGSAEEVWFYCLFLYLEGNSPYARIFGSFGEHYYFFF